MIDSSDSEKEKEWLDLATLAGSNFEKWFWNPSIEGLPKIKFVAWPSCCLALHLRI